MYNTFINCHKHWLRQCNFSLQVFSIILAFLFPLLGFAATNNIVVVDVSGSMAGYGYGSKNVFPIVKRQIDKFVSLASTEGHKIEIIPFASDVYDANNTKLVIRKGNTNIYKALLYAQKQIQKGRNNIFLITDGMHNTQPSIDALCSELEQIKAQHNDSVFYYYVVYSESAKQSGIASLFDGKNDFVLLDSLYVPRSVEANVKAPQHVSKMNVARKTVPSQDGKDCIWLIILLCLLVVVCLSIAMYFLLPYILSANLNFMRFFARFNCFSRTINKALMNLGRNDEGINSFKKQSLKDMMRQSQRLTNSIYNMPEKAREKALNKLSPKWKKLVEEIKANQMGRLPSGAKGTWSGEPGDSTFTVSDDYEWTDPKTHEKMTVKELRKKYKISDPIQVVYKNGEPIFDKYSIAETKTTYMKNYNYGNLKDLHDPVNDNLSRELDSSLLDKSAPNPVRDYVENAANDGSRCSGCRNTYHEKRDGRTIQVVPDFIHSICTHNGGRSMAAILQSL